MKEFIQRLVSRITERKQERSQTNLGEALLQLQLTYWSSNSLEKEDLKERMESLEWSELLRLHHLNCIDLSLDHGLKNATLDDFDQMSDLPKCFETDLVKKLVARFSSSQSPFRPRVSRVIKQPRDDQLHEDRENQLQGKLQNASITHLGSLEVIKAEQNQPPSVNFVPFDELQTIQFGPPGLFSTAQLNYKDSDRSEMVYLPLIYGLSWYTEESILREGSYTHFMFNFEGIPLGVGLGQQDFKLNDGLFGIASIKSIEFQLD